MEPLPKNKSNGLYQKYNVTRTDGTYDPGAEYIVLRIDKPSNNAERKAAIVYAETLLVEHSEAFGDLARDVILRMHNFANKFEKIDKPSEVKLF